MKIEAQSIRLVDLDTNETIDMGFSVVNLGFNSVEDEDYFVTPSWESNWFFCTPITTTMSKSMYKILFGYEKIPKKTRKLLERGMRKQKVSDRKRN